MKTRVAVWWLNPPNEVTSAQRTLVDVLTAAQRAGTLGDRPIADVIEHALAFVSALPSDTRSILDIGTGAGVPGLVIADKLLHAQLVLVDRRATRMDALRRGVASLGWQDRVTVLTVDVADLARDPGYTQHFDAVVSRGFGPPAYTARLARPFLSPGGLLVVSEPPSSENDRWPQRLLDECGFESVERLSGVVRLRATAL